ncbi:hypothetical protein LEP1GSC188_4643 [Leptospira weilii serovar Topaz str. LT2116]|uniref:Uncharacterized protein n=1 Tax=Leptospira weilii serovar Topaz str. LT2116 TaxID=1088540 RepID=M3FIX5_9LEPT|nr:hypothetical protein LEP1GSC188_4643 [Leptospira weilii serovar Topaz str. LT2116]
MSDHKEVHVRNIHSRTNTANTDSLNNLLLLFHQIRYTRVSGNVDRLTSVCVVSLSSLCNSFRSPSQIFSSLSCSIFDTTDVCGPVSGLIGSEIVRFVSGILSFLLVAFSQRLL